MLTGPRSMGLPSAARNMSDLAPTPPQIATGESVIHLTAGTTTAWTPQTPADYDALMGCAVFSSDDQQVGTVAAVFHPQAAMPAALFPVA